MKWIDGENRALRTKLGFTLIELLVVIAIIAILAAVLFPVLAAARERAKCASCMARLKQLGSATAMFVSDTGYYPGTSHYSDLQRYCAISGHWGFGVAPPMQCPTKKYMYGANEFFHYWKKGELKENPKTEQLPKKEADVPYPAKMVYLGDFWHVYDPIVVFPETEKRGFMSGRIWESHNDGGCYLYVDGHVVWTRAKDVVPSMFHWTWRP